MTNQLKSPVKVPILRVPFSQEDKAFIKDGIDEILSSGALTMGKHTARFEEMFSQFTGARFSVSCSNATTGLELVLRGLGIEGKSVIVPTNTFLATAYAVLHSGNQVIFADSHPETLCLDLADVKRRVRPDTAAVILVHIGGVITPEIHALKRFCDEKGIKLIEDCAHAHGCEIDGKQAGTLGVAGAFSFFPTKVLVTGEGGVITTDDEDLARRMRMIRNHGKNPDLGNRMSIVGNNYRISEITALLGVQQMQKAAAIIEERRKIAAFYDRALQGVPGIRPLKMPSNVSSSYYKYVAFLDEGLDRAKLKALLRDQYGVSLTGEIYADLCHTEPIWKDYTFCGRRRDQAQAGHGRSACGCPDTQDGFPGAEAASRRHICLPLYPGLSPVELEHVVESVKKGLSNLKSN